MNARANRRELLTFTVITAILLVGNLLQNLFEALILQVVGTEHSLEVQLIALSILLLVFFGIYVFASRRLASIFGSDVKMTTASREVARQYILTGFSPNGQDGLEAARRFVANVPLDAAVLPRAEFESYLAQHFPNEASKLNHLNWQQNLRAAYHHRSQLKKILVLLPDDRVSQFQAFATFMQEMFGGAGHQIEVQPITDKHGHSFLMAGRVSEFEPPTYEDYDYVYEGLRRGLDMAGKELGISLDETSDHVIVDTTPGIKIFSIAAAIITLNLSMKFSYVTNAGYLRFYDADLRFRYN